jgi:hypothetical protein
LAGRERSVVTADRFELTVSVSADARLVETVREVVVCAAQCAGCQAPRATAFARDVEAAVRTSLHVAAAGVLLPVTVRGDNGRVEVVVNGHTLTLDA